MLTILLQATDGNLLLGSVPESVGLLAFGGALIALAVGLRWVFSRYEEKAEDNFEPSASESSGNLK